MRTDGPLRSRRMRMAARALLGAGLAVFVFSMFAYTAWFWAPGNGIVLQCGRVGVFVSSGQGSGRAAGFAFVRTEPMVALRPLVATTDRTAFVAIPLWILGVPAALLLLADAWLVVRSRRGLCGECGYNLAGLRPGSPCPECGSMPRPHPRTAGEMLRAAVVNLGVRTRVTMAIGGGAATLAGGASGLYGLAVDVSRTRTVALAHGRLEVYRDGGRVPGGVGQLPTVSMKSSPIVCVPLDPAGWEFGFVMPSVKAGSPVVMAVPLWCGAPAVLAWPGLFRAVGRLGRGARRSGRPVSSVGVSR